MAEQTPRVNASILEQFTHRTVRILGKVTQLRGEEATIDAGGQINVHLNRVSFEHLCTQVLFDSGQTLSFHLVPYVKLPPKALHLICRFLEEMFSRIFPHPQSNSFVSSSANDNLRKHISPLTMRSRSSERCNKTSAFAFSPAQTSATTSVCISSDFPVHFDAPPSEMSYIAIISPVISSSPYTIHYLQTFCHFHNLYFPSFVCRGHCGPLSSLMSPARNVILAHPHFLLFSTSSTIRRTEH